MDVAVYTIDDKKYLLLNKKEYNDNTYLFLLNKEDEDDYLIRKVDKEDPNYLIPLDDENEVYDLLKNTIEV